MSKPQDEPQGRLVQAYERMLERVRQGLDEAEEGLEQALGKARDTAVELGELTRDEAERIAAYLRRDMQDMAQHLEQTGSELDTWFHIDLELIEARLLDLLGSVADRTRVELAALAARAQTADLYRTGEVTGPGAFECTACGHRLELHATGHIPPCAHCRATVFRRLRGAAEGDD